MGDGGVRDKGNKLQTDDWRQWIKREGVQHLLPCSSHTSVTFDLTHPLTRRFPHRRTHARTQHQAAKRWYFSQVNPELRGSLCALAPAAVASWLIPQSSRTTGALHQTRRVAAPATDRSAFKTFKSRLRRASVNVACAVKHRESESSVCSRAVS